MQLLRNQAELGDDPVQQAALGDVLQVAAQVAHDAASIALQPFPCLAHALALFGMDMTADHQRKPRGKSGVGLPQIHLGLLRQRRQLIARPLTKPGVRRVRA